MLRTILRVLILAQVPWVMSPGAMGQADLSLFLGAGEPGTESFELGVGVTSLIKVRLLPSEGIDLTLVETADRDVAGDLLIADQAELAALAGFEPITRSSKIDLRSVMAFKRSEAGKGPSLELIARADVGDEAVYLITKAILENGVFLEDLNKRSWDLSADQALGGLNLPLHPGAIRYYEEIGEANLSSVATRGPAQNTESGVEVPYYGDSTFFLYFNGDETVLNGDVKSQITELCDYADLSGAARIQVVGYSSSSGSDDGNLATERAQLVAAALRSNGVCTNGAEIITSEQTTQALPAGISAGSDDRVEVMIMLTP